MWKAVYPLVLSELGKGGIKNSVSPAVNECGLEKKKKYSWPFSVGCRAFLPLTPSDILKLRWPSRFRDS